MGKKMRGLWLGPMRFHWHRGCLLWRPSVTDWRPEGHRIIAFAWLGLEIDWVADEPMRYTRGT